MADEARSFQNINWKELFPSLNLFRAFRVAIHPSKLVLGLLAILLLYAGGRLMDVAWPVRSNPLPHEIDAYEQSRWSHESGDAFLARRDATGQPSR